MRLRRLLYVAVLGLVIANSSSARADECSDAFPPPPPLRGTDNETVTTLGIGFGKGILGKIPLNVGFSRTVKEKMIDVIHQYPQADQLILGLVIMRSSWSHRQIPSLLDDRKSSGFGRSSPTTTSRCTSHTRATHIGP